MSTARRPRTSTYERIYAVVRKIPKGHVMTYGMVAHRAGLPHGARQAGYAMRASPEDVPWQRVVGLSRRGFGRITIRDPMIAGAQRRLLEAEGVAFSADGEIDLERLG
jgi:methylated-DNA-protein-cysteine methyltransferase related protein